MVEPPLVKRVTIFQIIFAELFSPEHGAEQHKKSENFQTAKNHGETEQEFRAVSDISVMLGYVS